MLALRLQKSAWSFVVADPVTRLWVPLPHRRCGPNGAAGRGFLERWSELKKIFVHVYGIEDEFIVLHHE